MLFNKRVKNRHPIQSKSPEYSGLLIEDKTSFTATSFNPLTAVLTPLEPISTRIDFPTVIEEIADITHWSEVPPPFRCSTRTFCKKSLDSVFCFCLHNNNPSYFFATTTQKCLSQPHSNNFPNCKTTNSIKYARPPHKKLVLSGLIFYSYLCFHFIQFCK